MGIFSALLGLLRRRPKSERHDPPRFDLGPKLPLLSNRPNLLDGSKNTGRGDAWVIDCETTGLSAADRIVSFAAVEMRGPRPTGRVMYLIFNPERKSHPRAAAVHGFSDDVLMTQDLFRDHAPVILETLAGGLVVSHNAEFDCAFLQREIVAAGLPEPNFSVLCTMNTYRERWPGMGARLDDCVARLGARRSGVRHGALEDAFLAASLYAWLIYGTTEVYSVDEWPDPFNRRIQ